MAFSRFTLILLLVTFALVVESTTINTDFHFGGPAVSHFSASGVKCNGGLVGDSLDHDHEFMTGDEASRRVLRRAGSKFISYDALKKNNIPCKRRGKSYYGCGTGKAVNPYRRGCTAATHCKRYTK